MKSEIYCRQSWFRDKSITRYSYTMLLVGAVIGLILIYDAVLILTNGDSFINTGNFILLLLVLLVAVGGNIVMIRLNGNPIVTRRGISIPLDIADQELIEKAWNRVLITWSDITKMSLDSTVVNQWDCVFVYKSGSEIKISSQMGYTKECLANLIKMSEELQQKGIEVNISNTAIQLANE